MISRPIIDRLFEEEREEGAIFFNVSRGDAGRALMGAGYYSEFPDFSQACAEYIDELHKLDLGTTFEDDPMAAVDTLVASYNGVVVRKIYDHERARYEVLSRRKKTGLTDRMVTRMETVFSSIAPDDVILWKMRLDDPGVLTYAGIAFYGESDIVTRSPLYEPPTPKRTLPKEHHLGEPRQFPRPEE